MGGAWALPPLPEFGIRQPAVMSAGRRELVAIAKDLTNRPRVRLLDEPLGALDMQLRYAMQHELKRLQKRLGITFVYITHDQEEAINMSDRIAVMREGRFEQIGTPDEIYNHPRTSYVATFVGNANILKGTVDRMAGSQALVCIGEGKALVETRGEILKPGEPVTIAVRSENILMDENCGCGMEAIVEEKSFVGGQLRMVLRLPDGNTVVASRYVIDANVDAVQPGCYRVEAADAVLVDRDIPEGEAHA